MARVQVRVNHEYRLWLIHLRVPNTWVHYVTQKIIESRWISRVSLNRFSIAKLLFRIHRARKYFHVGVRDHPTDRNYKQHSVWTWNVQRFVKIQFYARFYASTCSYGNGDWFEVIFSESIVMKGEFILVLSHDSIC